MCLGGGSLYGLEHVLFTDHSWRRNVGGDRGRIHGRLSIGLSWKWHLLLVLIVAGVGVVDLSIVDRCNGLGLVCGRGKFG